MYADVLYEDTVERLRTLKPRQLEAIHTIIIEIAQGNEKGFEKLSLNPYRQLTKEEFLAEVDEAILEADSGMLEDADIIAKSIAEEFDLVIE